MTEINPVSPLLEAIAALSLAAGHLRELDREDAAHRVTAAADRLQLFATTISDPDPAEDVP